MSARNFRLIIAAVVVLFAAIMLIAFANAGQQQRPVLPYPQCMQTPDAFCQ